MNKIKKSYYIIYRMNYIKQFFGPKNLSSLLSFSASVATVIISCIAIASGKVAIPSMLTIITSNVYNGLYSILNIVIDMKATPITQVVPITLQKITVDVPPPPKVEIITPSPQQTLPPLIIRPPPINIQSTNYQPQSPGQPPEQKKDNNAILYNFGKQQSFIK
jgi:hypothetical protein